MTVLVVQAARVLASQHPVTVLVVQAARVQALQHPMTVLVVQAARVASAAASCDCAGGAGCSCGQRFSIL